MRAAEYLHYFHIQQLRAVLLLESHKQSSPAGKWEPGPESFQRAGSSYHICCWFVGIPWGFHPKPRKIFSSLKRHTCLLSQGYRQLPSNWGIFFLLWSFITEFWLRFHADLQCLYLPFFFCETCQSSTLPSKNEAVRRSWTIYFHYVTTFPPLFKMPIPYDGMLWFIVLASGFLSKISISSLCIMLYALPAACRTHCERNHSEIQVRIFIWAVSPCP